MRVCVNSPAGATGPRRYRGAVGASLLRSSVKGSSSPCGAALRADRASFLVRFRFPRAPTIDIRGVRAPGPWLRAGDGFLDVFVYGRPFYEGRSVLGEATVTRGVCRGDDIGSLRHLEPSPVRWPLDVLPYRHGQALERTTEYPVSFAGRRYRPC